MQHQMPKVSISYISEEAVLLEWPEKICAVQHQHIIGCQQQICSALKTTVVASIASYASLIIYYNFGQIAHDTLNALLQHTVQTPNVPAEGRSTASNADENLIEIPVYYGEDSGWDLKTVAKQTQLSVNDVIGQHTQTAYRAYALGFTPGFCYLGELPKQLQLPRKSSPRIAVPKGAVAIAEQQTAVYPNTSPGGWHVIGQTPIEMYTIKNGSFSSIINVGQSVKFVAITQTKFLSLGGKIIQEKST